MIKLTYAQCTATLTGDPCINAVLTTSLIGDNPSRVEWYRDGGLYQIREKRNPFYTIMAGGNTTGVTLFEPYNMVVDEEGNMYIVDGVLYGVVKWIPGATEGTIVAGGNGKGSDLNQFWSPKGIDIDHDGNIYVCDAAMSRVMKWSPGATTGVIVAGGNGEGGGASQLNGPENIVLDDDNNIYIADRWNNRIQKWSPGASSGITVAGANGQLAEPLDLDIDPEHNIYTVDYHNDRVMKFVPGSTTGVVLAGGNGRGTSPGQFSFTTGIDVLENGTIFVRDQGNYRIQKFLPGQTLGTTVAGGNSFNQATNEVITIGWGFGLFVDEDESIYVPEIFDDRVKKFVPASVAELSIVTSLIGNYTAKIFGENGCTILTPAQNVTTTPARPSRIIGESYVTYNQTGLIYRVNPDSGMIYTWTVPADAVIVRGQGRPAIKVNWGPSSGYVSVVAQNVCGQSLIKKKFVNAVDPAALQADATTTVTVSPNPATGFINIQTSKAIQRNSSYMTDITGRMFAIRWSGDRQIDISHLPRGTYVLHLTGEHSVTTVKFVKG
jgi:sugar lactone lactonase YvrE